MMSLVQSAAIYLRAGCHDCRRRHEYETTPEAYAARMSDWHAKHLGHRVEFRVTKRRIAKGLLDRVVYAVLDRFGVIPWWLRYAENTDGKLGYGTSAAYTITLASLNTSSNFTAGRESSAFNNITPAYIDVLVGGKITTGTGPDSAKTLQVRPYGSLNDTPDYPNVFTGIDADATVTDATILQQFIPAWTIETTNTSNQAYPVFPRILSPVFGGVLPKYHGLFVSHDTNVALNATANTHAVTYTPVYYVSA